jgi:phosphoglucomutase
MSIREVATRPFLDQRAGTAGLRKRVAVFQQAHYLENYLQSILDCLPALKGGLLVIGGDGRYHNRSAIQTAIGMAAANGVARVVVGQGGLLTTPAASHLVRLHQAQAGLIFTASHNPAGPDGDFGLKLNVAGGGQASEGLTERVYEHSRSLQRYRLDDAGSVELDRLGAQTLGNLAIDVVDPVDDYARLMQSLFDFDRIRDWFRRGHRLCFDAMHAATGPYARRIFIDQLGADSTSVINARPLEDFGGGHPDPNLIYARGLVDLAWSGEAPDLCAASDGDGDRNLILGRKLFVSPGDSLAMIAAHLKEMPGYRHGLVGVARSMPTSRAVDRVARALAVPHYETPTGWKFFANLLEAGHINLCGEESFGTSSDHVREKDGVWAVLAWLNILAATRHSVAEVAQAHWQHYGRHYFMRHDYDDLPADHATAVMQGLADQLSELPGRKLGDWTVSEADEFGYQDPVDGALAVNQGLRLIFGDAARIVVRLSGTGTRGATLRLYLERLETAASSIAWSTEEALAPLANVAQSLLRIGELTGRKAPSVVT